MLCGNTKQKIIAKDGETYLCKGLGFVHLTKQKGCGTLGLLQPVKQLRHQGAAKVTGNLPFRSSNNQRCGSWQGIVSEVDTARWCL